MLPIKHASIFKSRWVAVLWAAGICWFAWDVADFAKGDEGNQAANAQQDGSGDALTIDDIKAFEAGVNAIN